MTKYTEDDIFTAAFIIATTVYMEGCKEDDWSKIIEGKEFIKILIENFYKHIDENDKNHIKKDLADLTNAFIKEKLIPIFENREINQ